MNKTEWNKIGEVVRTTPLWRSGLYSCYAIMEKICENGDRKYKEVLMYSYEQSVTIITSLENRLQKYADLEKKWS